ncbi:GtrA family protein [Butyrivibrio sp. WCE2006]|uniref:GtrA family protein n=1 Tax=Butyrivibrio sp. WCE2006 TaxID=1410611 RepID=UPI000AEB5F56|nr:GtrA family protein [Butyrivibrio sp. WCE2006]
MKSTNIAWNIIEGIAAFVFKSCFKIVGRDYTDEIHAALMQFVKFGIVGVSNTVISYLLYTFSLLLMRAVGVFERIDYLIATVIAFVLSVLWSFYWNNKMVFVMEEGQSRNLWKALIKTYISYSFTGLFLNSVLMVLWVQIFHISEFIAPIINLLVSVPVNFIINKFWAFKSEEAN